MKVVLLILTACLMVRPAHAQYGGGTGAPNNPYQIYTAEQLNAIGTHPDDWDKHFWLMADIDLDPNLPGGQVYDRALIAPDINDTQVSHQGTQFSGNFDGHGFVISNVNIAGHSYLGLFGLLTYGAEVHDLGIVHANVAGTGKEIGILVGCGGSRISHCFTSGSVEGSSVVGGLAGYSAGPVQDSCSSATVRGGHRVGGLIGYKSSKGSVIRCNSTGTVCGSWYAGGLIGDNYGRVSESMSTGSVGGSGRYTGGLIGVNGGEVASCFSTAVIHGGYHVGGLIGLHQWNRVANCYSTGSVSGIRFVGGLLGLNTNEGRVSHCYSTGGVEGRFDVGGLVGAAFLDSAVTSGFWDVQTSGQTTSAGGTGKTTADMQTAGTFLQAGWDFVDETANGTQDIWWILEGQDSPRLWWEFPSDGLPVLAVDDFESYDDDCNRIFYTWRDGLGHGGDSSCGVAPFAGNNTGCLVGHLLTPYVEQPFVVHSGHQSMPYYYDNDGTVFEGLSCERTGTQHYSEAERWWTTPQDWTGGNALALTLWLRGLADNSPEPLYVAVEDGAGQVAAVVNPDPNAVLVHKWVEWSIPLSDFAGVDPAAITKMYIGVGSRKNPQPGGTGLIYIDDICLKKRMP